MTGKKSFRNSDLLALVACVVICEGIGIVGSFFTIEAIPSWYALLSKPVFTPPDRIFAPVWIMLYLLMGIAAYLIWKRLKANGKAKTAFLLFAVQLALNLLWTFFFFGQQSPIEGLAVIAILWVAILATIVWFWHISRKAAALMLPYLAWVTFALILNLYIFALSMP